MERMCSPFKIIQQLQLDTMNLGVLHLSAVPVKRRNSPYLTALKVACCWALITSTVFCQMLQGPQKKRQKNTICGAPVRGWHYLGTAHRELLQENSPVWRISLALHTDGITDGFSAALKRKYLPSFQKLFGCRQRNALQKLVMPVTQSGLSAYFSPFFITFVIFCLRTLVVGMKEMHGCV